MQELKPSILMNHYKWNQESIPCLRNHHEFPTLTLAIIVNKGFNIKIFTINRISKLSTFPYFSIENSIFCLYIHTSWPMPFWLKLLELINVLIELFIYFIIHFRTDTGLVNLFSNILLSFLVLAATSLCFFSKKTKYFTSLLYMTVITSNQTKLPVISNKVSITRIKVYNSI